MAFMPNLTVTDQKMHHLSKMQQQANKQKKKGALLLKSGLVDVTTLSTLSPYLSPHACVWVHTLV